MRDNLVQVFTHNWDLRWEGDCEIKATIISSKMPFNRYNIIKFYGFEGFVTVDDFFKWKRSGGDETKGRPIGKNQKLFFKGWFWHYS